MPSAPKRSCGIANLGINTISPAELSKTLMEEFKIWTFAINSANVYGVRITPHLYTSTEDLDALVKALKTIAKRSK